MSTPKLTEVFKGDVLSKKIRQHIARTINQNKEILSRVGVTGIPKEIGIGDNGIAYDVGGGKVLKVTSDESEAKVLQKLVGKKLNNLLHVFHVFSFPDSPNFKATKYGQKSAQELKLFGAVEEHLTPLTSAQQEEIDEAVHGFPWDHFTFESDEDDVRKWANRPRSSSGVKQDDDSWKMVPNPGSEASKEEQDREVDFVLPKLPIFRKYEMDKMSQQLSQIGVNPRGYWKGENIMKRGSTFVLIDPRDLSERQ